MTQKPPRMPRKLFSLCPESVKWLAQASRRAGMSEASYVRSLLLADKARYASGKEKAP